MKQYVLVIDDSLVSRLEGIPGLSLIELMGVNFGNETAFQLMATPIRKENVKEEEASE